MLVEFKNNIKIFTFKKMKFIKHVLLSSMQMHAKIFQKYKVWSPTLVVLFIKGTIWIPDTWNPDLSAITTYIAVFKCPYHLITILVLYSGENMNTLIHMAGLDMLQDCDNEYCSFFGLFSFSSKLHIDRVRLKPYLKLLTQSKI